MNNRTMISMSVGIAVAAMPIAETSGDIINVPGDFGSIQAAIADPGTVAGDTIVVAPGTYNESIDFLGKAITLRSSDPTNPAVVLATIIDGTGHLHVVQCVSGETSSTILNGFVITGGNANGGSYPDNAGGGMLNDGSSPRVTNCTFSGNTGGSGGGMHNFNSSPMVIKCTFGGNTADNGGGMTNSSSSPTVKDCVFSGNAAILAGGGMWNTDSNPTVTDCTFSGNDAAGGGGMSNLDSGPSVSGCTFSGNMADDGGGMESSGSGSVTVIDSTFSANTAAGDGGGMWNADPTVAVTGCTFSANDASGIGGGMFNTAAASTTVGTSGFCDNTPDQLSGPFIDAGGNSMLHCPPPIGSCPADINESGQVTVIDLVRVLACFGLPADPDCEAEDVNADGAVNILDLIEVLLQLGETCP